MRTILPHHPRLVPANAERVFKGIIFDVYHWEQKMFDGTTEIFEMLKRPDTVVVLAIKDHKLVVVLEKQPQFDRSLYSLPMGRHDVESETELEAAQRELLEETGLVYRNWRLIDIKQPQRKVEHFVYFFLATGFESQGPQDLDTGEKISLELVDRDEALAIAKGDQVRNLPTDLLERVKSIDDLTDLPQFGT